VNLIVIGDGIFKVYKHWKW